MSRLVFAEDKHQTLAVTYGSSGPAYGWGAMFCHAHSIPHPCGMFTLCSLQLQWQMSLHLQNITGTYIMVETRHGI